jgi:phage baseplate assembly protein V
MNHEIINRAIHKAVSRVRLAFRAVLTKTESGTPIQLVQADGMAGEQLQDNELMQHYGFTSVPLPDTQMIVLPLGGKTAHGIIIATEHVKYRLKALKAGEVALYDDLGQSIVLTRQGIIIKGAGLPVRITNTPSVTIDAPTTHLTGDLSVDGSIVAVGDVSDHSSKSMAGMRAAYNAHHHGSTPTPDVPM